MKFSIPNFFKDYEWPIVWMCAVTALLLGVLGFQEFHGAKVSPRDVLYLALQLFTLESGFVQGKAPLSLEIARFLAPAVTVYTAAKALAVVFREQLQRVMLKTIRGHVVIAGLGRSGLLFAEEFRKAKQPVVVIEKNEENDQLENCRDIGAFTLIGDARTPEILSTARIDHARVLLCVANEDGINAEIAVQARALLNKNSAPLTSLVHIVDSELCKLLRKQELMTKREHPLRVEFFNLYESAVRDLLSTHPPFAQTGTPHILIIGLGKMGESLLIALTRSWSQDLGKSSERFHVSILDRFAKRKTEAMEVRYPFIHKNCVITTLEMETGSPEFYQKAFLKSAPITIVYVCLDNDSLVLSTALLLRQWLPGTTPIYLRMSHQRGLATLLQQPPEGAEQSNLIPFGALERMCTPALLSGGMKEILARVIHEEYVRKSLEERIPSGTNPALRPWEELPEWLKESNRNQADHIGQKLIAVGCDVVLFSAVGAEDFQFEEKEIESLSRMEHERWMLERKKEGWTFAPGVKNVEQKTSPYLVPYEQLTEEIKEYNRTTVRELPRFLARAGYQIYRIE